MDIQFHPPENPEAFAQLAMQLLVQAAAKRLLRSRKDARNGAEHTG